MVTQSHCSCTEAEVKASHDGGKGERCVNSERQKKQGQGLKVQGRVSSVGKKKVKERAFWGENGQGKPTACGRGQRVRESSSTWRGGARQQQEWAVESPVQPPKMLGVYPLRRGVTWLDFLLQAEFSNSATLQQSLAWIWRRGLGWSWGNDQKGRREVYNPRENKVWKLGESRQTEVQAKFTCKCTRPTVSPDGCSEEGPKSQKRMGAGVELWIRPKWEARDHDFWLKLISIYMRKKTKVKWMNSSKGNRRLN